MAQNIDVAASLWNADFKSFGYKPWSGITGSKHESRAGEIAQLVECLPHKHKTLSSIPSTEKQTNKEIRKPGEHKKRSG